RNRGTNRRKHLNPQNAMLPLMNLTLAVLSHELERALDLVLDPQVFFTKSQATPLWASFSKTALASFSRRARIASWLRVRLRKSWRANLRTSTGVKHRTVAVRGASFNKAISPNEVPAPRIPRLLGGSPGFSRIIST